MQLETMLKLYVECKEELRKIEGAECSKCPLSKDIRLSIEVNATSTGVLSEVTIQVNPCLLLTEVADQL